MDHTLLHFGANEELVSAFNSKGVEFVIIGGLAVSWYCPERQVDDMDLMVNPTYENSARISSALDSLRLNGHTSASFTRPGLQVPLKSIFYAELLTPRSDGPSWSEVTESAVEAKLFHLPVRLASVAALILLKEHAVSLTQEQKEKHIKDIELLKRYIATYPSSGTRNRA